MAKKGSVNKTKAVMDYWNQHPKATAAEVAEAMKKQGVEITVNHIYGIRNKSKKKAGAKQNGRRKAAVQAADGQPSTTPAVSEKRSEPTGTITLEHIKAVSQSVKAMGGFGRLNELLVVIREVGGLRRFKDLVDAITITEADTVVF